jgi:thiol-disulfide isomerase/thioredoxin
VKKFFGLCCILNLILYWNVAFAQNAAIIKYDDLAKMMARQNDTTYIFNFFATWCEPCVEEFPDFQRFAENYAGKKIKLVFVSLDFRKDYRKRLLPFLKKNHVTNEAVLLDETDYNSWIDKVDTAWDGNIPATLVLNNNKHIRKMFALEFIYDSLTSAIEPFLQ